MEYLGRMWSLEVVQNQHKNSFYIFKLIEHLSHIILEKNMCELPVHNIQIIIIL